MSQSFSNILGQATSAALSAFLVCVPCSYAMAQEDGVSPRSISGSDLRTADGVLVPLRRGGDFTLFQSGSLLEIQVRLMPTPDKPSAMSLAGIAMSFAGNKAEIYLDDGRIVAGSVNELLANIPDNIYPISGELRLSVTTGPLAELFSGYKLKDGHAAVLFTNPSAPAFLKAVLKDSIRPDSVELSAEVLQLPGRGLLHRPDGNSANDLKLGNGEVLRELSDSNFDNFVESWRVSEGTSLFSRSLPRAVAVAEAQTSPVSNAPDAQPDLLEATLLFGGDSFEQNIRHPANGHYAVFQEDGNFCVYRETDDGWVWCINNDPTIPFAETKSVTLQLDGQLVAKRQDGSVVWQLPSEAPGYETSMTISEDGALQILTAEGVLWSSHE